jgi:rhodanese-related sulfurtransferase
MGFFNRFRKQSGPQAKPAQPAAQTPAAAHRSEAESRSLEEEPAMPQVQEMSVEELKAKLDKGETPLILDVREPYEYQIVHLPNVTHIPMNTIPARLGELDKNAEIVVQCHHGSRSWNVAAYMMGQGFTNVKNLTGGIHAWSQRIDKTMRTY